MDTTKPLAFASSEFFQSEYATVESFWEAATAKSGGGVWWHLREAFVKARTRSLSHPEVSFDTGTSAMIAKGKLVKVKASDLPGLFPIYRLRDVEHDPTSFEGAPDVFWDEDDVDIRNDEHLTADQRFALFG